MSMPTNGSPIRGESVTSENRHAAKRADATAAHERTPPAKLYSPTTERLKQDEVEHIR